jgi:hypothetical protein
MSRSQRHNVSHHTSVSGNTRGAGNGEPNLPIGVPLLRSSNMTRTVLFLQEMAQGCCCFPHYYNRHTHSRGQQMTHDRLAGSSFPLTRQFPGLRKTFRSHVRKCKKHMHARTNNMIQQVFNYTIWVIARSYNYFNAMVCRGRSQWPRSKA